MPARIRALALIDGAGSGAYLAAVSILLAANSGTLRASAAIALGSLGRILSLVWAGALTREGADRGAAGRAYTAATVLMVVGAIGGVHAAGSGTYVAVAALAVISGAGNNLTSTLAATARKGQMTSFYPMLMVGGAAGAVYATYILQSGHAVMWIHALLALQLTEPLLLRPYQGALVARPSGAIMAADTLRAAALAAAAYGPLAIYAVLVSATIGAHHVGAAMLAYAAGAAAAEPLDRALRKRTELWREDRWSTIIITAAIGVATWVASGNLAGLLAGRFAAGVLMFLSQGMLLRSRYESVGGSEARVAGVSAGLGMGAGLGSILAATLFQTVGAPAMAMLLALATLSLLAAAGRNTRPDILQEREER